MTIAVVACLVLLLTACWLGALVRARLAAEPAETMVRDLYDRYVTEVRTLTYAYLVQAAPAEEWLARIRSQVIVPEQARRPGRRLPAQLAGTGGLLGLLVSPGDGEPAALLRLLAVLSGLTISIGSAVIITVAWAASALAHADIWWTLPILVGTSLLLPAAYVALSRLRYLWAPGGNAARMEPGPTRDLP